MKGRVASYVAKLPKLGKKTFSSGAWRPYFWDTSRVYWILYTIILFRSFRETIADYERKTQLKSQAFFRAEWICCSTTVYVFNENVTLNTCYAHRIISSSIVTTTVISQKREITWFLVYTTCLDTNVCFTKIVTRPIDIHTILITICELISRYGKSVVTPYAVQIRQQETTFVSDGWVCYCGQGKNEIKSAYGRVAPERGTTCVVLEIHRIDRFLIILLKKKRKQYTCLLTIRLTT